MRAAVLIVAPLLALVPAAAAAAQLNPRALSLQQADVPAGFQLDREETGVRSNAAEIREHPELAALFARVERLTGYSAEFRRESAFIGSRVDVVRRREGARILLAWYDREVRKGGVSVQRSRAGVGAESWLFWETSAKLTIVAWRYRHVFAAVLGTDLTREQTLALARSQQRRIAAAVA